MRHVALLLLAAIALAGCGGGSDPAPEGAATSSVQELVNVLGLRSDFEADAGKTRVIILLSPT